MSENSNQTAVAASSTIGDRPPTDWKVERLANIADIRFSNVDKKSEAGETPVQLCNYMDVYANDYITSALDFMEATANSVEIARFTVNRGDVLATKDSETPDDIGVPAVVVEQIPALVCGYHLAQIKPQLDVVDSIFLAKQIGQDRIVRYFSRLASGSTRYGLSTRGFEDLSVWLPPLPQQRKIAEILTTVDRLIEKTEALIGKYQSIKQGMMHDLFTRGVDQHGHLRPTYNEAPELYKESELGWIPKEWETRTLNDLVSPARPIVYGILMPGYGYPGGIPVIKVKDIKNGVVDQSNILLTNPEIDQAYRRSKTRTGDLLFTIRGTVGRTAFVPETLHGANITQDTARIRVVDGDPRFIRGYLEMPVPGLFIACHTLGVAVQGINLGDVRRIPVAFPPVPEQNHIGDILEAQERQIQGECLHLEKLRITKTGLMQDLLTGKVRVKVDEFEEAIE